MCWDKLQPCEYHLESFTDNLKYLPFYKTLRRTRVLLSVLNSFNYTIKSVSHSSDVISTSTRHNAPSATNRVLKHPVSASINMSMSHGQVPANEWGRRSSVVIGSLTSNYTQCLQLTFISCSWVKPVSCFVFFNLEIIILNYEQADNRQNRYSYNETSVQIIHIKSIAKQHI